MKRRKNKEYKGTTHKVNKGALGHDRRRIVGEGVSILTCTLCGVRVSDGVSAAIALLCVCGVCVLLPSPLSPLLRSLSFSSLHTVTR